MTAIQTDSEFQAREVPTLTGSLATRIPMSWRKYLPTGLVLVLGACLSLLGFYLVVNENRAAFRQNFENTAASHVQIFRHSIDLNISALKSIRSLFHASKSVKREDFRNFTIPILTRLVGIQALEWIPRVADKERPSFEQAAQQDGISGFTFTAREVQGRMGRAGTRDEYFPVYYVEPLERNKVALGFDLGSNAKRQKALHTARDTGNAVATAPITLVQETSKQLAFLVFVPIYRLHAPVDSIETRRNNLIGFSLGVYRIGDMIEATLRKLRSSGQVRFYIFDVSDAADRQLLYQSDRRTGSNSTAPSAKELRTGIHSVRTISVSGRTWEIVFAPAPGHIVNPIDLTAIIALLVGLMFSGLVASYIWSARRRAEKIEELVSEKTFELTRANEELARSNDELQQFAMVASHDLQEPLRKVQAFADRLKNKYGDVLDEQGMDYLARMQVAAQRMETLMNNLLELARVTSRTNPFAPVDLGKLIVELVAELDVQIQETGAQIEIGALPTLNADSSQMRQLFQNLIGNALKYRRQDVPPVIKIASQAKPGESDYPGGEGGTSHQITVSDNGIGFEDEYAERIFGIFQRLHGRTSYSGTGVGLAIVRKIVERHKGAISASGVPDHSATFTITLPEIQPKRVNQR